MALWHLLLGQVQTFSAYSRSYISYCTRISCSIIVPSAMRMALRSNVCRCTRICTMYDVVCGDNKNENMPRSFRIFRRLKKLQMFYSTHKRLNRAPLKLITTTFNQSTYAQPHLRLLPLPPPLLPTASVSIWPKPSPQTMIYQTSPLTRQSNKHTLKLHPWTRHDISPRPNILNPKPHPLTSTTFLHYIYIPE